MSVVGENRLQTRRPKMQCDLDVFARYLAVVCLSLFCARTRAKKWKKAHQIYFCSPKCTNRKIIRPCSRTTTWPVAIWFITDRVSEPEADLWPFSWCLTWYSCVGLCMWGRVSRCLSSRSLCDPYNVSAAVCVCVCVFARNANSLYCYSLQTMLLHTSILGSR